MEGFVERMGYMPCYKFPEEIDEDATFKYYKFRVPRHYIRDHISEGNVWPGYEECFEPGARDESVVLGVGFFPVYTGVELLDEDADFLYYKVRVPKEFLNTPIKGTPYYYSILYETKDYKLKTAEEMAETEALMKETEDILAGISMPDRTDLEAVRSVKEKQTLLYEVVLYCPACDVEHDPEVAEDLWTLLHGRACNFCSNGALELRECKSILEEDKEDE